MEEMEEIYAKEEYAKHLRKRIDWFVEPKKYEPVLGQEIKAEQLELIINFTKPYIQFTDQYNLCIVLAFARAVLEDDTSALAARTKELTEGLNKCLGYLTGVLDGLD